MADPAFDTLEAARRLEAGGIQAEQADAIVEVVYQSTSQMVTVERFEAGVAALHSRIDSVRAELSAKIDSVEAKLFRTQLIVVGIFLASNALMATIFGILLTNGAFGTVTFGAP